MNELIEVETKSVSQNGYEKSSMNALRHGILSRHVVLPHENAAEYNSLLEGLKKHYDPQGPVEEHLVEELAGTIWRKQRVLMAEGANLNKGLKSVINDSLASPTDAAVPWKRGMRQLDTDFQDMFDLTEQEVTQYLQSATGDLAATEKAQGILNAGGRDCYKKAVNALQPDSRDWWLECVANGEFKACTNDLTAFIDEQLLHVCEAEEKNARFHHQIKQQTLGESLQCHRLVKLNRYETHLDRKFERTLAMLIKLKSM